MDVRERKKEEREKRERRERRERREGGFSLPKLEVSLSNSHSYLAS